MSRHLISTHRRLPSTSDNPYQPTTATGSCYRQHPHHLHHKKQSRNNGFVQINPGLSDETDSQSYYDYHLSHGYQHKYGWPMPTQIVVDDASDSTSQIHYGNDNDDDDDDESMSCRRFSRNTFNSERQVGCNDYPIVHKDVKRIYPIHPASDGGGVYQEVPTQMENVPVPRRVPPLSDRPQSSMSSGVTSAVVDGCGGKCQTFENICYFFLQLVFMMGILIGISLCIAGLVLRKSAARNLQVLVYIGIMLAVVSGVLLGIQWNARNSTKKRKLAVRNAKRTLPIPLETLNQPRMTVQDGTSRVVPQIMRPLPVQQPDQQGIPWWRRKDLL